MIDDAELQSFVHRYAQCHDFSNSTVVIKLIVGYCDTCILVDMDSRFVLSLIWKCGKCKYPFWRIRVEHVICRMYIEPFCLLNDIIDGYLRVAGNDFRVRHGQIFSRPGYIGYLFRFYIGLRRFSYPYGRRITCTTACGKVLNSIAPEPTPQKAAEQKED